MREGQTLSLESEHGPVKVMSRATPGELDRLVFHKGIGVFAKYRSILTQKSSLVEIANQQNSNVCLAVHEDKEIVGYCVLRQPPAGERWAQMDPPIMYEVLGETGRGWRDIKVMKPMLKMICEEADLENLILYIVGYSWTWDLEGTKKNVQEYRDTIIHLLTPYGFRQYPTNEPNVGLRPENLFMARFGENIEKAVKKRFVNLLFGIKEDE